MTQRLGKIAISGWALSKLFITINRRRIMAQVLWEPSEERIKSTNMYKFMGFINEKYGQNFDKYDLFTNGPLKIFLTSGHPCGNLLK
jgi:hypothetical protein